MSNEIDKDIMNIKEELVDIKKHNIVYYSLFPKEDFVKVNSIVKCS